MNTENTGYPRTKLKKKNTPSDRKNKISIFKFYPETSTANIWAGYLLVSYIGLHPRPPIFNLEKLYREISSN